MGNFTVELHDSPNIFNVSLYFPGFGSQTHISRSAFGKLLKER